MPKQEMVPFSKLISLATPCERLMFLFGHFSAFVSGAIVPVTFAYLVGNAFDIFNPKLSKDEFKSAMMTLVIEYCSIGLGLLLFSYLYYTLLLIFANRVAQRLKEIYLEKIL